MDIQTQQINWTCAHCQKVFNTRERLQKHHQWHDLTEQEVHEEPISFGARYVRNDAIPEIQHRPMPESNLSDTLLATSPIANEDIEEYAELDQIPQDPAMTEAEPRERDSEYNYSAKLEDTDSSHGSNSVEDKDDVQNEENARLNEYLQHVLVKYRPWEGDNIEKARAGPELKCSDCSMLFDTSAELEEHHLSYFCEGNNFVVYVMVVDRSQQSNYRIERYEVPFDGKNSLFKCGKCDTGFSTEKHKIYHERSHPIDRQACLHCGKIFSSKYELDEHYEWHYHIHQRQSGELRRAQGHDDSKWDSKAYIRVISQLQPIKLPHGITAMGWPGIPKDWEGIGPRADNEIVGASWNLKGNLETMYAESGVLRESLWDAPLLFLHTQKWDQDKVNEASDVLNGVIDRLYDEEKSREIRDAGSPPRFIESSTSTMDKRPRNCILHDQRPLPDSYSDDDIVKSLADSANLRDSLGSIPVYERSKEDTELLRQAQARVSAILDSLRPHGSDNSPSYFKGGRRGVGLIGHGLQGNTIVIDSLGRKRLVNLLKVFGAFSRYVGLENGGICSCGPINGNITFHVCGGGEENKISDTQPKRLNSLQSKSQSKSTPQTDYIYSWYRALHYMRLDQPREAIPMLWRALRSTEMNFGKDDLKVYDIIQEMARCFEKLKWFEASAYLYRRALMGRQTLLGLEHKETLISLETLAASHRQVENMELARRLWERAYEGFRRTLGVNDRSTLLSIANLAGCYSRVGLVEKGKALLDPVLSLLLESPDVEDEIKFVGLANFLAHVDNAAFPNCVVDALRKYENTESMGWMRVLDNLACVYSRCVMMKNSAKTYHELYTLRRKLLAQNHEKTLDAIGYWANALELLGDLSGARQKVVLMRSLTAQTSEGQLPDRMERLQDCDDTLFRIDSQEKRLKREAEIWGIDIPQECNAKECTQATVRFCPGCRLVRFCSEACLQQDIAHFGTCIPSVTWEESKSIGNFLLPVPPEFIETAARYITSLTEGVRPRVRSSETILIDPKYFVTMRITKPKNTLITVSIDPRADLRWAIAPSDSIEWTVPSYLSNLQLWLDPSQYILIAPGQDMLDRLVTQRDSQHGTCSAPMEFPDDNLIEYAQSIPETMREDGRNARAFLAFYIIEWDATRPA